MERCVNGKKFKVLDVLSPQEFIININLNDYKDDPYLRNGITKFVKTPSEI